MERVLVAIESLYSAGHSTIPKHHFRVLRVVVTVEPEFWLGTFTNTLHRSRTVVLSISDNVFRERASRRQTRDCVPARSIMSEDNIDLSAFDATYPLFCGHAFTREPFLVRKPPLMINTTTSYSC